MKLDQDFLAVVKPAICYTWSQIGHDVYECGGRVTNGVAIEACIDADRVSVYGGSDKEKAAKLITEACTKYAYTTVHRFLCKHIKLA